MVNSVYKRLHSLEEISLKYISNNVGIVVLSVGSLTYNMKIMKSYVS